MLPWGAGTPRGSKASALGLMGSRVSFGEVRILLPAARVEGDLGSEHLADEPPWVLRGPPGAPASGMGRRIARRDCWFPVGRGAAPVPPGRGVEPRARGELRGEPGSPRPAV